MSQLNLMSDEIHNTFYRILNEYANIYENVINNNEFRNPFRELISKKIPQLFRDSINFKSYYKIEGSYGKGRWTQVPWIAIFDQRITSSAQHGVYIVYLINKDKKELFLVLEQAATEMLIEQNENDKIHFTGMVGQSVKNSHKMHEKIKYVHEIIKSKIFQCDRNINSGSDSYNIGSIYYKKYSLSDLPTDKVFISDLQNMLALYNEYYVKSTLDHIKRYIAAKGFTYEAGLVENFYLCMKSKPFVLLAGVSGTGKTRLAKLFAEAIGAEFKLVAVRPDWSDSSDLLGHVDLNGKFVPGPALGFIRDAADHPDKPYFLCLDEMNLARVEYYLSDILSIIETRDFKDGRIVTEPLMTRESYGGDTEAFGTYGVLGLPDNLVLVGTVNMDETTFPFSKKVLDRANAIEFNDVDLAMHFDATEEEPPAPLPTDAGFLRCEHLYLSQCADQADFVERTTASLQKLNEVLAEAEAHVGYRVRDEIMFYLLANLEAEEVIGRRDALDNEIMQKILPRLQGSTAALRRVLSNMFRMLAGAPEATEALTSEQMFGMLDGTAAQDDEEAAPATAGTGFPRSTRKIAHMMRRFEEDGFTTYWI